jgi:hypothetical protein
MAVRESEIEARAERFIKAGTQCECVGVGCGASTHSREMTGYGERVDEHRCAARVTSSGTFASETRVIVIPPKADPKDDANLRVYCEPCASEYDAAHGHPRAGRVYAMHWNNQFNILVDDEALTWTSDPAGRAILEPITGYFSRGGSIGSGKYFTVFPGGRAK